MSNDLQAFFDRVRPAVETALESLIPSAGTNPSVIHDAMRYSALGGGKRVRPCLCVAAFSAWQDDWQAVIPVASAIEMIHAYSLIHDDLPAMDDDDFRRGKPSCHKKFGEAMAILAGDALLTLAFEVLASCEGFPPERLLRAGAALARAAGTPSGMVAGQVLDLEAEGAVVTTVEQMERIHRSKTGAMIGVAVWMGAYLGKAPEKDLESIAAFCDRIGVAFQVIDDILDVTQTSEQLGKTAGKDTKAQKATYPSIVGLDKSRKIAKQLTEKAFASLKIFKGKAVALEGLAEFLLKRDR